MCFSLFERAEIETRAKKTEEGGRGEERGNPFSPLPSSIFFALVPISTRSISENAQNATLVTKT